jgi:hypothetical protein
LCDSFTGIKRIEAKNKRNMLNSLNTNAGNVVKKVSIFENNTKLCPVLRLIVLFFWYIRFSFLTTIFDSNFLKPRIFDEK